jgi:hypothetical protein
VILRRANARLAGNRLEQNKIWLKELEEIYLPEARLAARPSLH